jgi:NDP-4-keto-2,6-dideoxyhexose 3-C-methyltransferase
MYRKVERCFICGNTNLVEIVDLGEQYLTGVFPSSLTQRITSGPLRLVKCMGADDCCGLVQLQHVYSLDEMYGENYGYRSGLNKSMITHLHNKVQKIIKIANLCQGDLIIDIGSNDSTTLQAYPPNFYQLAGVDPTGHKFREYYPPHIQLIPEFFSLDAIRLHYGSKQAKVVTSFSMFYDLEDPLKFMREVYEVLHPDGVWVFEQSYLPAMLEKNSFDTICHEHLEYYALKQIKWMADKVGFRIVDVEFNAINGGSFSVAVAKQSSSLPTAPNLDAVLQHEADLGLDGLTPFRDFATRIAEAKKKLLAFISEVKRNGKSIYGLGASTKGNVLLQYCQISENEIGMIGEVNPDKYGCFCPGNWVPIVPEDEILAKKPDYLLVLPWHFRSFFEHNEKFSGVKLVFPLPNLEVVG